MGLVSDGSRRHDVPAIDQQGGTHVHASATQMPYGGPQPQPQGGPAPSVPVGAYVGLVGALLALIGSCGTWVSASFLG